MSHWSKRELEQMYAAAVGQLLALPHDHVKEMTADQVISLTHVDHCPIRECDGGPFEHWNLDILPIVGHRRKTAKIDVPQIRKADRLSTAQEDFRKRILARDPGESAPRRSRIPSRPFPKRAKRAALSSGQRDT